MKRFYNIFLMVLIILCFSVSVFLYAENQELEEGSLKVFSPRAYFTALSNLEIPSYDLASALISSNEEITYTYEEMFDVVNNNWFRRLFHLRDDTIITLANLALEGRYGSFEFRGTTYRVQTPSVPYSSVDDVIFYVEAMNGTFYEKITYFFKYIGDCIKSVGEFVHTLLPFNDDYYTTLTLPRNFGGTLHAIE